MNLLLNNTVTDTQGMIYSKSCFWISDSKYTYFNSVALEMRVDLVAVDHMRVDLVAVDLMEDPVLCRVGVLMISNCKVV